MARTCLAATSNSSLGSAGLSHCAQCSPSSSSTAMVVPTDANVVQCNFRKCVPFGVPLLAAT